MVYKKKTVSKRINTINIDEILSDDKAILRYTIPLSNLIIEARKAKKLSLRDFCKILQEKNIMIGIVALVYLEENGVVPGISAMLAIADVLEIDKKELLYSALLVKTSDYMLKWAHDYELVKQIKTP